MLTFSVNSSERKARFIWNTIRINAVIDITTNSKKGWLDKKSLGRCSSEKLSFLLRDIFFGLLLWFSTRWWHQHNNRALKIVSKFSCCRRTERHVTVPWHVRDGICHEMFIEKTAWFCWVAMTQKFFCHRAGPNKILFSFMKKLQISLSNSVVNR